LGNRGPEQRRAKSIQNEGRCSGWAGSVDAAVELAAGVLICSVAVMREFPRDIGVVPGDRAGKASPIRGIAFVQTTITAVALKRFALCGWRRHVRPAAIYSFRRAKDVPRFIDPVTWCARNPSLSNGASNNAPQPPSHAFVQPPRTRADSDCLQQRLL